MKKIIISNPEQFTKPDIEDRILIFLKNKNIDHGQSSLIGYNLYAKKNDAVGVAIKVNSKGSNLNLTFTGYSPSFFYRFLLAGLLPYLILMPKWKNYERKLVGH